MKKPMNSLVLKISISILRLYIENSFPMRYYNKRIIHKHSWNRSFTLDKIWNRTKLRVIRRLRKLECVIYRISSRICAYFSGIAFIRQIESSLVLDHRREITFMIISHICYYATAMMARNSGRCFILENAYDIIYGYTAN